MDSFAGKMIIAICHCLKESAQTKRLATWLAELGPYPNHRLLVGRDARAEPNLFANSGFGNIEEITITGDAWNHWPESCNNAFRQIAKHIEYGTKEFWLWIEADVVPLKKGFLDQIEAEYRIALADGKYFLGDFVHVNEPGFIDHCSGVAVYPGRMSHHAGDALLAHEMAWDVIGASQIIPQMHKSKSILHRWKYPAFDSWEQVEERIFAIRPEAVLFHSDKNNSLIPLLRTKMNLPVPVLADAATVRKNPTEISVAEARESTTKRPIPTGMAERPAIDGHSRGGQFICDIFIKSFPGDYEWLNYCLRSIAKFASGFRAVTIVSPDANFVTPFYCNHIPVEEFRDGYLFQQVCKLNADKYTDADHILFMDSDCVFIKPVTPETFMRDGKPMWLMTPIDKAREDQRAAWVPVMTKWMDKIPEYELMFRHPFMFPRWFFEKIRGFCANQHGVTLDEYVMSQPHRAFSEFNCAGFLAYEHFRNRFEWINTATHEVPPETVLQNWSPAGLTEEIKAELEEILKGGENDNDNSNAAALAENPNIRQTREGIWVLVKDDHISKWVEEKGSLQHDYETLPLVLAEIPVGGTVVDGGAFIGDTTGPFLERVGPSGKVFAFEPNPDARECLRRNCPTAIAYAAALGNSTEDWMKMERSLNAGANFLLTSLDDKENVPIVRLDTVALDRCDAIKLDIEGMEMEALRGAEQTINRFHPKLVLEINEGALARQGSSAEEISDWLFKHGYKWRPLQSDITAASPQYDILCTWIQPAVSDSTCAVPEIDRVKWWIDQKTGEKVVWDGTQWVPATQSNCEKAGVDWNQFELDARFTNLPLDKYDVHTTRANDSRDAIVRDAVAVLRQLCTAPRFTSQVRKELKAQGVTR